MRDFLSEALDIAPLSQEEIEQIEFEIKEELKNLKKTNKIPPPYIAYGKDNYWYGKDRSGPKNPRWGAKLTDQHKQIISRAKECPGMGWVKGRIYPK